MFNTALLVGIIGICSALKLCVNCQYFFIEKNTDTKFGKCFLFPKEEDNFKNYLLTGKTVYDEYNSCSIARSNINMCGKEGRKYRKRYDFQIVKNNEKKWLDF